MLIMHCIRNLLNTHKGLNNKEGKGLMNMVEFYGHFTVFFKTSLIVVLADSNHITICAFAR